jgi:succinate dehydrogenase hydrophobic anchor subunit
MPNFFGDFFNLFASTIEVITIFVAVASTVYIIINGRPHEWMNNISDSVTNGILLIIIMALIHHAPIIAQISH